MKFEEIKALIEMIDQSNLNHFTLKTDEIDLVLSKREQAESISTPSVQPVVSERLVEKSIVPAVEKEEAIQEEVHHPTGEVITSPLVGVAYLAPTPDSPVFKQVGDTVEVGDVLCIVEAMKVMNEIKSDVAGVVAEVLVENQQIVEYGAELFRIG